MKNPLILLPLFAFLIGCTTSNLTADRAIFVQPSAQATPTKERPIKVTLMSDYGALTSSGATFYIYDNNKKVAQLESREMTVYYAEPGNHSILLGNSRGHGTINSFSEFRVGENPEFHFGVDASYFYVKRVK